MNSDAEIKLLQTNMKELQGQLNTAHKRISEVIKEKATAYDDLQKEANAEFEEVFKEFNEDFDPKGELNVYIKDQPLFQTIKNLQERLKLGLNKARAGVEEESRGMRRQVAETQMTRTEALRILEIIK